MSSQVNLDAFDDAGAAESTVSDYRPWSTTGNDSNLDDGRQCQGCGAHVTKQFVRVFCADGEAHACLACTPAAHIRNGAAADPSFEARSQPGGER